MIVLSTCVLVTGIVVCVIVIVFAILKMISSKFSMKNDNNDDKFDAMREQYGQNNLLSANFIVPFL